MQQKHLSYEELSRYLEASEDSHSDMKKMEVMMEHIMECEYCQERLQNTLMISSVCEAQNLGNVLLLLEREEEIRRELAELQHEMIERDGQVRQATARLGEVEQYPMIGEDSRLADKGVDEIEFKPVERHKGFHIKEDVL